jgi:hypothetical protein
MTGPLMVGNPSVPQVIPTGHSSSGPVVAMPNSGVYSAQYPAQKSRIGLIIAILAVLAVGGGVAAYVVVNGGHKPGVGPGSGSQIAGNDPGHGAGSAGSAGGGTVGATGNDAAVVPAPDAADIAAVVPDAAVGHTGEPDAGTGSAAGNAQLPPEVPQVQVLLSARNVTRFEVYENGVKLFDGPDVLPVPKGETRTVLLKAPGFRDKPLPVDSTKHKVQFVLARLPAVPVPGPGHTTVPVGPGPGPGSASVPPSTNPGPGSGHIYTPNLPPDCSNKILDPKSKACVDQYCAKHPDEDKCHMM